MRKIEHKEAELAQQRTKHQDKVHEIRALEQTLAELNVSRVFVPHAHHTGSARTQTGSPPLDGPTASCAPWRRASRMPRAAPFACAACERRADRKQGDRLRLFSPEMPRVVADVAAEKRWHAKPIGPLGSSLVR